MNDYPWMQFFAAEFVSDPQLSMCAPGARGVWMDAICAMHLGGRTGELVGTVEQLARICRCGAEEMALALEELSGTGAAEVTRSNGVVTLVCRRMHREHKKRKSGALRTMKHRQSNATTEVTIAELGSNIDVTSTCALDSNSENTKNTKKEKAASEFSGCPTMTEVIEEGKTVGCPADECERFYHHYQSVGWVSLHGQPIADWRSKLALWTKDNRANNNQPIRQNGVDRKSRAHSIVRGNTDRNAGTANGTGKSDYSAVGKRH